MPTDPRDFEHDVTILDRYLAYSTEIVRLALLGIAAIGYLFTTKPFDANAQTSPARTTLYIALLTFGIGTAAGLLHRYFAPDSLAEHLASLRKNDASEKMALVISRNKKFKWSGQLLGIAAVSLFLGAAAIAYAFALVIRTAP